MNSEHFVVCARNTEKTFVLHRLGNVNLGFLNSQSISPDRSLLLAQAPSS